MLSVTKGYATLIRRFPIETNPYKSIKIYWFIIERGIRVSSKTNFVQ